MLFSSCYVCRPLWCVSNKTRVICDSLPDTLTEVLIKKELLIMLLQVVLLGLGRLCRSTFCATLSLRIHNENEPKVRNVFVTWTRIFLFSPDFQIKFYQWNTKNTHFSLNMSFSIDLLRPFHKTLRQMGAGEKTISAQRYNVQNIQENKSGWRSVHSFRKQP